MNEVDILQYINNDESISKYFRGIMAFDELPFKCMIPSLYIINTDSSGGFGKHWISIFVNLNEMEYLDSLGRKPKELLFFLHNQNMPKKSIHSPNAKF